MVDPITRIRQWFKRDAKKEPHSFYDALYDPVNALFEVLKMPHDAITLCAKCEHLRGKAMDKENTLEMLKLHDIDIED